MEGFNDQVINTDHLKSVSLQSRRESIKLHEELKKIQSEQLISLRRLKNETAKLQDKKSLVSDAKTDKLQLITSKDSDHSSVIFIQRRPRANSLNTIEEETRHNSKVLHEKKPRAQSFIMTSRRTKSESEKSSTQENTVPGRTRRTSMPAVGLNTKVTHHNARRTSLPNVGLVTSNEEPLRKIKSGNPVKRSQSLGKSTNAHKTITEEQDFVDGIRIRANSTRQLKRELQKIQPRSILEIKNTGTVEDLDNTRQRIRTISNGSSDEEEPVSPELDLGVEFGRLKDCHYIRKPEEQYPKLNMNEIFISKKGKMVG